MCCLELLVLAFSLKTQGRTPTHSDSTKGLGKGLLKKWNGGLKGVAEREGMCYPTMV